MNVQSNIDDWTEENCSPHPSAKSSASLSLGSMRGGNPFLELSVVAPYGKGKRSFTLGGGRGKRLN